MKKIKPTNPKKLTKQVKKLNLPKIVSSKTREKAHQPKNTTAYYHCLADNWKSGKITDCCAKCKRNAGALNSLRTAEIKKLSEAYQQVGVSLTNLLKPLK